MNGTMITAESSGYKITRNSSCFKKVSPYCDSEISRENSEILVPDSDMSKSVDESENVPDSGLVKDPVLEPRRSGRMRQIPQHLQEFVLK